VTDITEKLPAAAVIPPDPRLTRRRFLGSSAIALGGVLAKASANAAEPRDSRFGPKPFEFPQRRVKAAGSDLNVIDTGTGPAVLLLHGFPNSSMDWRHQIPALIAAGFRMIVPNLLGLGQSDKPLETEHYTVAKDVERTLALLAECGVSKARIVGHDRGAGIAWDIAARHPELAEQLVAMTVGHPNAGSNPRRPAGKVLVYAAVSIPNCRKAAAGK